MQLLPLNHGEVESQKSSFHGCFRLGTQEVQNTVKIVRGKLFDLQLELFRLQLSFLADSPLRPLLDALSTVSKKAPTVSKKAKAASKKAPTASKRAKIVNCK